MKGCKSWWCNYQYNLKGYIILIFPEARSVVYRLNSAKMLMNILWPLKCIENDLNAKTNGSMFGIFTIHKTLRNF